MLIDTHCHIHFNAYKDDMEKVIERARAARVFMIAVGTERDTSAVAVEVAEENPEWARAAIGLHPNHLFAIYPHTNVDERELATKAASLKIQNISTQKDDKSQIGVEVNFDEEEMPVRTRNEDFDADYYKKLAQNPMVVAIGECGLDWYRIPQSINLETVKAKQKEIFRQHLALADELDLPVIVHCRDAHDEIAKILKEYVNAGRLKRRGVIHCFTAGRREAYRYIDLDFYIAFGGVITFKSKKPEHLELLETAREMPVERIVIETDAPYLTPEPNRGKRNEPLYVKHVAEKLADLRGMSYDEIVSATTQNALRLFKIEL